MSLAIKTIAMMGAAALIFRSEATTASGPTVTKPAGVAVGDLVFVTCAMQTLTTGLSTSGGSAWTGTSYVDTGVGQQWGVFWKILNSTDVANSWDFDGGASSAILAMAYQAGASSIAQRGSWQDTGASAVMPAFTPAGGSKGAFVAFGFYDGSGFVNPTGFTQRGIDTGHPGIKFLDNFGYPGGTVTGAQTGGHVIGAMFEVV